jgi:hypothetical protein
MSEEAQSSNGASDAAWEAERRFPGTWKVRLIVWREGDELPRAVRGIPEDSLKQANTLARMREVLGGEEGFLTDRAGNQHRLSLAPWADQNPETTYCAPEWRFVPDAEHLDGYKAFWKEYFSKHPPRRRQK